MVEKSDITFSGVSISTDGRQIASATLLIEVGYFFSRTEEATSLNNVVSKKYIIKYE